jgi:hypothetical protein
MAAAFCRLIFSGEGASSLDTEWILDLLLKLTSSQTFSEMEGLVGIRFC